MGQIAALMGRRRLSQLELGDARERIGPDSFTDDELQTLFARFTKASGNRAELNKKQFKAYIERLKIYPRATKNEQYDPLFRAYNRSRSGDHITWLDFLDFHVGMKFGLAAANTIAIGSANGGANGGGTVDSASATLSPRHGSPYPQQLPADTSVSISPSPMPLTPRQQEHSGDMSSHDGDNDLDGAIRGPALQHVVVPPAAIVVVANEYRRRHRELLANIMLDIFDCDRSGVVSRAGMGQTMKELVRWLNDEDDIRDDHVNAHVAQLFKEARVPRVQSAMTRDEFVTAFVKYDRFARHLTALV